MTHIFTKFQKMRAHALFMALVLGVTPVIAATEVLEQTKLDLTIIASENVNADTKERAQPIEVRIYELKTEQAFEAADYFSLANKDKEILAADLTNKDVFILRPGDTRTIERKADSETKVIGILAGYRELGKSVWRATYKLPPAPVASWYRFAMPAKKAVLQIRVDELGLRVVETK